ncbi:MAG TPA: SurA N-terminal domain-containing protein [Cerasibacillus sp.]|uniref:SurA N-terminal domain-containing protein n=1 Tax=Cerasibacillus sp. TaxID=2498711 RepID=UPI002F425B33
MKNLRTISIGLMICALLITLTACGEQKKDDEKAKQSDELTISEEEKVADDKVVAEINNHKMTGQYYNSLYIQTKMKRHQFGQDIEDREALKNDTLDELIAHELMRQEAEVKGIHVTEEEVEEEFNKLKEENGEQLDDYLKQFQLTEDSFKEQIMYSLVYMKYVEKEIPVKVSDKEAKALYDDLKKDDENLPTYDEIEGVLKEQISQRKQQEELQKKIKELKETAKIKEKL